MNILITGAEGQLGKAINSELVQYNLVALNRKELNLINLDEIDTILTSKSPSLIIHLAAYTNVDKAENDCEKAMTINYFATKVIADYCYKAAIPIIFFSSDYVFDGLKTTKYNEDDPSNPLNIYGQSKALAESYIVSRLKHYVILRTSGVYDEKSKNFFSTISKTLIDNRRVTVVADQFSSPTSSYFLAGIVKSIVSKISNKSFKWGIYHLTNKGSISWYEFARLISFRLTDAGILSKINEKYIIPIKSENYISSTPRPLNSLLNCEKIERELDITLHSVEEALIFTIKKLENYIALDKNSE